jgi:hypothetical protein
MEGGLGKLTANPIASLVFVLADVLLVSGFLLIEARVVIDPYLAFLCYLTSYLLISSLFTLALGGKLRSLLRSPEEFVTRLVFAIVAWIIVTLGALAGLILLIVPGLYLSARLFVAEEMILLDGAEIFGGMRASWDLTEGSAWPIVAVVSMLLFPAFLPPFIGSEVDDASGLPTLGLVAEWTIASGVEAFGAAAGVYAWQRLTGQTDGLGKASA